MRAIKQGLFEIGTPTVAYAVINDRLSVLREEFHRNGRLDDSNAKLDEVIKLFATYLAFKLGSIPDFPIPEQASADFVHKLQAAFLAASAVPYFVRNDGISIFGPKPSLALSPEDIGLAIRLTELVIDAISEAYRHRSAGNPYDILNEAFGHFVRDNFRGNIEDAQYLTPAEVVDFMVDAALNDLKTDGRLSKKEPLLVADPCCGVGSFITAFAAKYRHLPGIEKPALKVYGQDKVERMVRIATVNLALFSVFEHSVTIGNSLYEGSPLDDLNGKVDLILTNPPFGARFDSTDVFTNCASNTPYFSKLRKLRGPFESELLFIDRNLTLLREGGILMIVIPDGVISASGLAAMLRSHLKETVEVRAVIDLPSVTFAQAGTRTRTSVLYLRKSSQGRATAKKRTFMSVVSDLGYHVSSRKGVQVKIARGKNELPEILEAYVKSCAHDKSTRVSQCDLVEAWTPNHYIGKANTLLEHNSSELAYVPLSELVEFCGDSRRSRRHKEGDAFISILHVLGEGIIDIASARRYAPITPGVPINPDEILLSRINPRIPRVVVAPDLGQPTLCSSEFEVMRPKGNLDSFSLAYLLLSPVVQSQIQSLTSGTSASHNRIKTRELATIKVPVPRMGSKQEKQLTKRALSYAEALKGITKANLQIARLRQEEQFV